MSSQDEALRHPLVQYGDAVMSGPGDIRRMYNSLDLNILLEKLDDEELRVTVMQELSSSRTTSERSAVYDRYSDRIWRRMHALARVVPTDPGEVLSLIVEDRDRYNEGLEKERPMTDAETKTKEPKAPKYDPKARITMGADKDGKKYGTKNNPKRAGSKAHATFAHYGNGTTVGKFSDAVGPGAAAALKYDVDHGFITIDG